MKMTNEEKQAFFAQYWLQEVGMIKKSLSNNFSKIEVDPHFFDFWIEFSETHLELRSVEQLTDEELNHMDVFDDEAESQRMQADYLRSIGVLVPFRHFTPEMLIAEGVVKIKQ
tara:strand:+ start:4627 stop:4965 length:339 start_codon:yes stop_codon:yes gene_type:complete